jgi:acyl dehydratase
MENKINIGDFYEHVFSFNQDDVIKFSNVTGDNNPIHLDKEYAKKTPFKTPIVHGFLAGSVFSKVFGTIYPGEGTIYLKQEMFFLKPMFTDQPYKAVFEIINTDIIKNRAVVKTIIYNFKNEIVIKGEAIIKHSSIF